MMKYLRALWARFRRRPTLKPAVVSSVSRTDDAEMWTAYAALPAPPPPSAASIPASLRALERRRRRHDKFVQPQGPSIPPKPRLKTQEIEPRRPPKPKPAPADPPLVASDGYIADRHHEDDQKVLYSTRELYGEFTFRDTILQQLDRYFFYLTNMRKSDPSAYTLYRQVGAQIIPYLANGSWHRTAEENREPITLPPLPEWFHKQRPSFGCFAYGADPETEKFEANSYNAAKHTTLWVPKFMYYTKYAKAPPELQRVHGGDVYVLSVWWHTPADPHNNHKYGARQDIGFFVSEDGQQIMPLRTLNTTWIPVRGKREKFSIPQRTWRLAREYEEWAKQHGQDPRLYLADLFLSAIQKQGMPGYSLVRVTVRKGNMAAVFSVNHERLSYFFQDRDVHLTESGRRKPIFHAVRAHARSDGTRMPIQFRGERNFTWAGYDVQITVPSRDHIDINTFDVGGVDEHWRDETEPYVGYGALGKVFADNVKGAPLEAALTKMKNKRLRAS